MKLVADRYIVFDDERVIDLSSGDEVRLSVSSAGGPTEQTRWSLRCDRWSRLYHPAVSRLLDYGFIGDARRFEAWRWGAPWRRRRLAAERAVGLVVAFLRANGLTEGAISMYVVRSEGDRAVVVPSADAGYDAEREPAHGGLALAAHGLDLAGRPAVGAIAELMQPGAPRVGAVGLWASRGSGLRTAVEDLSRAARLHGYVPVSSRLADPEVIDLLKGRSLFLIDQGGGASAWRRLLDACLRSPGAHLLLLAGREEQPHVHGLMLEPLEPSALVQAVRPRDISLAIRRRVEAAAHRTGGLPGRFVGLLWGARRAPATADRRLFSRVAFTRERVLEGRQSGGPQRAERAAERAPVYGPDTDDTTRTADLEQPPPRSEPGNLGAIQRRLQKATRELDSGRYARGDRTLRSAIAALARRRQWGAALEGVFTLAAFLLKRGRPQDAQALLARARDYATRDGQDAAVEHVAILTGVAWTDLGRLDAAEGVLRAALNASRSSEAPERVERARLALARCLFWRGWYAEAAALLTSMARRPDAATTAIAIATTASRIAVGCRDLSGALAGAAEALEMAECLGEPAALARAAYGSAFAHLAIGDRLSVDRDVGRTIHAARAARDPLLALRARLLAAESARRAGRSARAMMLLRRIGKLPASRLPPIVKARCALLADLLSAASPADVVKKHVAASRLEGLALFAPEAAGRMSHDLYGAVDDSVEILRSCQTAEDEGTMLTGVCARLRVRLNAIAVGLFGRVGTGLALIASHGSLRADSRIGDRVMAAGQLIAPHLHGEAIEGGIPVRYGGETVGVLVGRWAFASPPDIPRASILLTLAATAAGPAVASANARRAESSTRGVDELLGVSRVMIEVRQAIEHAASSPFAVLIEGESGTGKELVARAIHRRSSRRGRPLCTLNCAALPDDLVEAELFGHARGAFTGAVSERPGVFEEAHTGTLVLDEIGELSLRAQAKVLRTIQEGELRRVGENVTRRVDVRIVSATNRDLRQEVAAGRFRLDLLYRLDVVRISLPPLRARREDIAILVDHCWREATSQLGSRATLSAATIAALARYDWPGNVRELQNVLAALVVRCPTRGVVPPTALPPPFDTSPVGAGWCLEEARRTFDDRFVRAALVRNGGHRARTAEDLGVTRQGLSKLMTRLGISG